MKNKLILNDNSLSVPPPIPPPRKSLDWLSSTSPTYLYSLVSLDLVSLPQAFLSNDATQLGTFPSLSSTSLLLGKSFQKSANIMKTRCFALEDTNKTNLLCIWNWISIGPEIIKKPSMVSFLVKFPHWIFFVMFFPNFRISLQASIYHRSSSWLFSVSNSH